MFKCPICEGEGGWPDDRGIDGYEDWDDCGACDTTGRVGFRWYVSNRFWNSVPVIFVEWYIDHMWKKEEK